VNRSLVEVPRAEKIGAGPNNLHFIPKLFVYSLSVGISAARPLAGHTSPNTNQSIVTVVTLGTTLVLLHQAK
jgi:hypothetical protein